MEILHGVSRRSRSRAQDRAWSIVEGASLSSKGNSGSQTKGPEKEAGESILRVSSHSEYVFC